MFARLCLALLATTLFVACSSAAPSADTFLPPAAEKLADGALRVSATSLPFVEVSVIGATAVPTLVRAPARVAFREGVVANVGAPVEGRISEVHVRVGQRVTVGEPLVSIVSASAATVRGELARARVMLRAGELELARQSQMVERGVGIGSERARAEADVAQARAILAALSASAGSLGRGAAASVVVRAPIAGTVLERSATIGQSVTAGAAPLVVVGEPGAVWIVAEVFERELALLRPGLSAQVRVAGSDDIAAHVETLGGSVDPVTRRASVYLALDDASDATKALRAGMYARVSIDVGENGVSVPASAVLVKEGGRTVVFVARDARTFIEQEVDVGATVAGRVPVFAGLVRGARVVTRGALLLDGTAGLLR